MKGIAEEIENYEPTQLNTLLERSDAEIKKQTWLNLGNDDSISSKVIRTQTEQFLELFSRTLKFFNLKDVKISLHIIVLIVRGSFDRTHGLNKLFFALNARALLMFNYDKPSRIFPCILLTRHHMIFLVQFGINKHLLIFSKTTNFVSL